MADKKITALTALTTPAGEDLIPIVDDPSGSAETKKVTWENLLGTGTANYVTKWSTANKLTNSLIQDDGTTVGINTAPNANYMVHVNKTFSSSSIVYGLFIDARNTSTGSIIGSNYVARAQNATIGYVTGMNCAVEARASSSDTTISSLAIGVSGRVQVYAATGKTASIVAGAALQANAPSISAGGGTESITTLYGVQVKNQGVANVTNAIGLEIETQSGAVTTNIALRTNGGLVIFNEGQVDADLRWESDTKEYGLMCDAGNTNITVNAASVSANYDLGLCGDGVLMLKETTTPTADTNYGKLYTKSDNVLYFQDGGGTEHALAYA